MHGIIDNPEIAKVLGEALSLVVAESTERGAGKLLGRIKGNSQRNLVGRALTDAVVAGFVDSRQPWVEGTESWVRDVADIWGPAFRDSEFVGTLIDSLASPKGTQLTELKAVIAEALENQGCDLDQLGSVIWVEQFLHTLPILFWENLKDNSREEPELRPLMELLLAQRADARQASVDWETSPRDYLRDIKALLSKIAESARDIPAFLPAEKGLELTRRVVIREGVRKAGHPGRDGGDEAGFGRAYLLPVDYAGHRLGTAGVPRLWPEVADHLRQVVVLSDPGMGKSWLVRTESLRLTARALSRLEGAAVASEVPIPVPLRCDQLARADGETLGQAVGSHFAELGWIPARSRHLLAKQIDSGQARLLLDAHDELPGSHARERFGELLRSWASGPDERRWLLTSRIAGYAGPLIAGVTEIEVQALAPGDVTSFVRAWGLPQASETRLLDAAADPAIGGMARIPLLLALLCSLAAQIPAEQELPRNRTALYERLLRWYLDRPHHGQDSSAPGEWVETALEILSKVAYDFAIGDDGWRDVMPQSLLVKTVRASGRAFDDLGIGAEQFITDIAVKSGVLVPEGDISGGRSPRYLFLHRTFAEYLTARHLASMDIPDCLEVLAGHLWFDPEWAPVIPMLGGELHSPSDAQKLFRFLASRPDDAYQQALIAAAGVLSERQDRETLLPAAEAREFADKVMKVLSIGRPRPRSRATRCQTFTTPSTRHLPIRPQPRARISCKQSQSQRTRRP